MPSARLRALFSKHGGQEPIPYQTSGLDPSDRKGDRFEFVRGKHAAIRVFRMGPVGDCWRGLNSSVQASAHKDLHRRVKIGYGGNPATGSNLETLSERIVGASVQGGRA